MRANLPRYRQEEEEARWKAKDPIRRLEAMLAERHGVDPAALAAAWSAAEEELDAAIASAKDSPEPTADILAPAVSLPHALPNEPGPEGGRTLSMVEAVNEGLRQAMEEDGRVLVIGEDVGRIGGIFGCTRGLMDAFGAERVRDTPISEQAIGGLAVGAAISGWRPVVEVQIFDFVTLMMDMIVNQAAKFRFMLGGTPSVPLVVRGPQGGGIRLAAQHSQCLEAWFAHVPGLVVIAPSTPYDAKGLLVSAVRDDNPVVFLEHKLLYVEGKGPVPEHPYAIPIGKADVKREGTDVTVVAIQAMVPKALQAAQRLEREGISVEVVDPRTIRPLDEETILASVRKTNRCVVVHEAWKRGGFGAEIAAMVMERAFDHLDAPVARVGAPDVPMPYNDALERGVIPSAADIAEAVRAVCYRS
jgi:2-oxoisovalerate dehydrogenase E1 component